MERCKQVEMLSSSGVQNRCLRQMPQTRERVESCPAEPIYGFATGLAGSFDLPAQERLHQDIFKFG